MFQTNRTVRRRRSKLKRLVFFLVAFVLSLLLLAGVLAWRRRVAPSLADETARRAA